MTSTVLSVIEMDICAVADRQDCRPVEATVLPDDNYYLTGTDEVIPADMATPSPDDRFHRCAYNPVPSEFDPFGSSSLVKIKTRCFFAPMNSW